MNRFSRLVLAGAFAFMAVTANVAALPAAKPDCCGDSCPAPAEDASPSCCRVVPAANDSAALTVAAPIALCAVGVALAAPPRLPPPYASAVAPSPPCVLGDAHSGLSPPSVPA